ncbi:MAG TPA: hypothetical protein VK461_07710 [Acidimicrobiales bacterium]|nr:hypothetical protein [Acidimicrobiales bacterium]
MASWREGASQQAQDDLDGLMNQSFPFAQRMLAANGEFYPYAVGVSQSGELRMFAADPGTDEHPGSIDVLNDLVDGLRSERDALRAVALASDVRVADCDAIRLELEHREGIAIAVLLRYHHVNGNGNVEYGALTAGPGEPHIWS